MSIYFPKAFRRHKIIQLLLACKLLPNLIKCKFNKTSKCYLDLTDPEPRNIFITKTFEPDFFGIAKAFLPNNGIFFDLGANHGLCSFGLLPCNEKLGFHLFEANEFLVKLINKSCTLHKDQKFKVNYACVSEKSGSTNFSIINSQSGQSHVATSGEAGKFVKNLVLDEYCAANSIKKVDFAKMDLEGQELPALKGWKKNLERKMIKAIYLEIMPENQERYGFNTAAPMEYLESFGYELFLCKKEEFGKFGKAPVEKITPNSTIQLSSFRAKEFPSDYATDILALAPI